MGFTAVDGIFAFVWFVGGFVVFQTRGASKTILGVIGGLVSLYSLISLVYSGATIWVIASSIVINKITGVFTDAFYLLGANISRGEVMGRWSVRKISLYIAIIGILVYLTYALS
jgi:hypothetical protein